MSHCTKTFILTLPGDDQRRAPLLSELERQGIVGELFFGIDGRKGLSGDLEKQIDRPAAEKNMRRRLTDGEFACALSHRAIYQKIVDDGLDAALILEDDAIISSRLGDFLRAGGMFAAPMILLYLGSILVCWLVYRRKEKKRNARG